MRALTLTLLLVGCAPELQEGHFACPGGGDDECPSGFVCAAQRCWRSPPDAQVDVPTDAGPDGGDSEVPPPVDACTPQPRAVDLLLMVDDSGSMAEEQAALTAAFPRLARKLAEGDLDGDGIADFDPIASLRVGVVSSDMGVGGHSVPICDNSMFGDDGVLITEHRGRVDGCATEHPAFLEYTPPGGLSELQRELTCYATLGTEGCGFEQQLEAVLKATTPSDSRVRFFDNTLGHAGTGLNAGFLRDDAVRVVLLLSDEEDCSAENPDIFDPGYSMTGLNRRCDVHADQLWDTSRYRALADIASDPRDVIFAALVGVPPGVETGTHDAILAHPDMAYREDPAMPQRLLPACRSASGDALPGRRYVEVAQTLEGEGASTLIRSICREDFEDPFDDLVALIATRLDARCP